METVYRTYLNGELLYSGDDLGMAIREWDRSSFSVEERVGGVAVATYVNEPDGLLQVRDGWILHVLENGHVFLNPNLTDGAA